MSFIRPFRALRPKKENVKMIASPPYDVLNREETKKLIKNNPISFLRVVKAEADLPDEVDIYDDRVYEKSRENLESLINEGYIVKEPSPSFYLYRQETGDHIQNGLVCIASIDEYNNDLIKKHESTRKAKEEDRTRHIDTLNAQTGPVFLAYRDDDKTHEMHDVYQTIQKEKPLYNFKSDDSVRHTVWRINDKNQIKRIQGIVGRAECLYVADGHHRSKAASLVRDFRMKRNTEHKGKEEYNYFLSVIFPHTELKILAYNRIAKDINYMSIEEFLNKVNERFSIEMVEESYEPVEKHHFGMYLNGKWYHLEAGEGSFPEDDAVRSLDVSILQENILNRILLIKEPKQSERIAFVGGIKGLKGLESLVDSGEFVIAFALYPTSMEELMVVADAGLNMPPKSTWFEPKLKSGLFVHQI